MQNDKEAFNNPYINYAKWIRILLYDMRTQVERKIVSGKYQQINMNSATEFVLDSKRIDKEIHDQLKTSLSNINMFVLDKIRKEIYMKHGLFIRKTRETTPLLFEALSTQLPPPIDGTILLDSTNLGAIWPLDLLSSKNKGKYNTKLVAEFYKQFKNLYFSAVPITPHRDGRLVDNMRFCHQVNEKYNHDHPTVKSKYTKLNLMVPPQTNKIPPNNQPPNTQILPKDQHKTDSHQVDPEKTEHESEDEYDFPSDITEEEQRAIGCICAGRVLEYREDLAVLKATNAKTPLPPVPSLCRICTKEGVKIGKPRKHIIQHRIKGFWTKYANQKSTGPETNQYWDPIFEPSTEKEKEEEKRKTNFLTTNKENNNQNQNSTNKLTQSKEIRPFQINCDCDQRWERYKRARKSEEGQAKSPLTPKRCYDCVKEGKFAFH